MNIKNKLQRSYYVMIIEGTILLLLLSALLYIVSLRYSITTQEEYIVLETYPLACAPAVNTDGLIQQPHYEDLFTEEDLYAVASTIRGEAGYCSWEQQCKVAWCVCNRFDVGWSNSIKGICAAPGQFHGYNVAVPTEENMNVAYSVLHRWSLERQGLEVDRELDPGYLWFCATGDGITNSFRNVY